ncbi:hypothetical protein LMG26411_01807 [Cupriavidus numazuensis]|uniref:DUF4136 domain-containing protein n=1 Tax=Cupriavidus numazuensis TaxID=221992 RepID=A0ABM8TE85_9BURK|nr:DUF4136 domain-containing protein [Cupriavidus numazuensis]CAG2140230.1 hypothetical protein LMG26411_01807 [Cupriavidus numazuensis]
MELPRSRTATAVAVASALLAACASAPDIKTDYNHNTDFSVYRSFGFVQNPGTDRQGYESLTTQYLKTAVQREMTSRGYQYNAQAPDLLVNFNARTQEKVQVTPAPPPMMGYYGYRGGLYAPWPGYGFYNDVYTYTEGTLNIDVVDRKAMKLVWEGVAVGSVDTRDQSNIQQRIDKVVGQIFAKYPFRAGGQ